MRTNIMCDPSNLPMKGCSDRKINTIKNVKIANGSHCVSDADIVKTISEILTNDYALQQKPYINQIERATDRNVMLILSANFKAELYEVAENMANIYLEHNSSSTILANVAIEYITNVRVGVTIYLTDASSATIYTDKFSGDMLLISEDSQGNAYLENDLTAFDYTDIQSALRSMVEDMFFRHQRMEIKKDAKKRNIFDPFVWVDNDFDFHLSATAIDMEDNMNLIPNDRIKLKIDYFREEWTHIKVTVTIYNTTGDREALKVSGDVGVWGFID